MPVACDLEPACQPSANATRLLIVDASVNNSAILLSDLQEGTQVIYANKHRLGELAKTLETRGQVDELHILTHGAPGALSLGGELFDSTSIEDGHPLAVALKTIAGAGSKIALWACNVAQSGVGRGFLKKLSHLTGATVFATDRPVGAAAGSGSWDIGTAAPFSAKAQAAYPHTLPTFDFTGATGNGTNTVTETESGVTMTITISPSANWVVADGGGLQGSTADIAAIGASDITYTVTFTFSSAVTIEDFYYFEGDNSTSGTSSWIFTVTGGSGTTLTFTSGDFSGQNSITVDPTDWTSVTSFTVTATGTSGFQPAFDTINFSTNSDPTITGAPTDITVTEETLSNVDLSAVTLADSDGDTLTVTLTISEGVWGTPASGAGNSVTETRVSDTVITLVGTAANINTYLDTASNITYTSATDDVGDNAATLDFDVSDGNGGTANSDINIDVTNVNDDPTITGLVTDIGFTEDTAGNVNLSASTFADVDESGTMTVTITASEGSFGTPADGNGDGVVETRVSDTQITLVGTAANINTYLNTASNIQWTPEQDDNGGDTSTFTITANDGEGSGDVALGTVNADVTAVNDDPTATGIPTDITVTEETASNVDLSGVDFTDVDSAGTVFVTLTASAGTLASSSAGGVTVSGSGTGTLTLEGTFAAIETFLDTTNAVRYTGATDDSGDNAATLSISANDDDGSGDVALGSSNFDITNINDDPTITGLVTDLAFTEDTAGNVNLSASTIADVDESGTMTVTITASEGSFGTPADGNGDGVVETRVSDTQITLVGTAANINTYLNTASNIQWTPEQDDNGGDTSTFTITANDGEGSGDVALGTVNADVTAVNDDPTATGIPTDITVTEETASNVDLSGVDFTDVDSAGTVFVTLTASAGTLASSSAGGVTVSGSGTGTLTLEGTFAAIETFLDTTNAVRYTGATDDSGDNAATLSISANDDDGSGDVALGSANIDITNVNDDPTITGLVTDIGFTEDTQGNVNLSASTIADVDESGSMTVTITASEGNFDNPADGAGNSVTETRVNDTTITLVGTAANINTYLNTASNIQWTPEQNDNGGDTSTFTITANDGDGSGDVALGTVNADVTAVNDDPTLSGLPTDFSFTEEATGNLDLSALDFTDVDSAGTVFVTLSVDTGTLVSSTAGGVTVSGSGTDTVTLEGTFTAIETFLDTTNAVRYTGANNVSGDDAATLTVTGNDDDGSGDVALGTANIDITDINDAPSLTATGGNPTHIEDQGAVDLFNTVSASTVETDQRFDSMTLTVTNVNDGANEILSFDGSDLALTNGNNIVTATNSISVSVVVVGTTATVSFSGEDLTNAQFQTLIDALTYRNTSDDPTTAGNRVITVTGIADDGGIAGGGANTDAPNITSTVTVTANNDAPSITGVFGDNSTDIVAGTGAGDVTAFNDAAVSDDDSDDFSGGFLTIAQTAGTGNGSWAVDGTNVTSGGDATVSAGETIQVNGVTIGTVDANDDGQSGNDFTINFTTGDANADTVEDLLQNLTFDGPSGIDTRSFTLTLNDNDGTANNGDEDVSGAFSLDITPNPPVFTNLDGDSGTWTEGDDALDLDNSGNATITDADSANFDGGDLTVAITANQAADDRLEIDTSGSVSLSAGQTAGSTVSVSGTAIGTIQAGATGGSGEDLIINLNGNATPALVQTLVRELQYDNASADNPTDGDRTINITVTDGTGGASANNDVTINVDPVNDNPTLTGLPTDIAFTEDTAGNLDLSASDFNDDDSPGSVTVTLTASEGTMTATSGGGVTVGGTGTGTLTLTGTFAAIDTFLDNGAAVQYTGSANDSGDNTATVSVTANDGDGSGDVALGTTNIDITNVNDLPTATDSTVSMQEDSSYTFSASDFNFADVDGGDSLTSVRIDTLTVGSGTFQLSGVDVSATDVIAIADINAGNLVYTPAPDDNGNGLLTLTFSVNDGTGFAAATSNLTVDVQDVAENRSPRDLSLSSSEVDENDAGAIIGTLSATDPEGESITFGIESGGERFIITDGNVLQLRDGVSLDFEAATNGLVSVEVFATDSSGGRTTQVFAISVNDVVEGSDTDDEIMGSNNDEEVSSGNGDDEVDAGRGDDTVDGGNGDDTVSGGAGNDDVLGGDGNDDVNGGTGDDTVDGGNGDDTVSGGTGSDSVGGGAGNDDVDGGEGNDRVDGGNGNDDVGGGEGNDRVFGGNDDDTVTGGNGDDTVRGDEGDDRLSGGTGNDVGFAGPGDNGNDTVEGNAGDDTLGGGRGDDLVVGGNAGENVNDTNPGSCGDDILFGGDGDDLIVGGSYNTQTDTVVSTGGGNNQLWGGSGNDTVFGDEGNDIVSGGSGDDVVQAGGGNDTVYGGRAGDETSNDTLRGGNGDDLILASVDDDVIFGEDGNDTLFGGAGDDTVDGGNGDDILWAGGGNDDLTGGNGADTFTFGDVSGNDTVADFAIGDDTLDLRFASTDFASVAEVQAAATNTTQDGEAGVLIDLGDGDSVFVIGLSVSDLTTSTVTV